MNDICEFGLDVMSLKDFCRAYVVEHSQYIDWTDTVKYGLPEDLITYLDMYNMRGLSWKHRQEQEKKRQEAKVIRAATFGWH